MAAKKLSQREMADLLGVSVDRVKSLTSGRVKKLAPQESKALVEKLHVSGNYLATGAGEIFQTPGEVALERRLTVLGETSATARQLEMPMREQELIRDILYGVAMRDSPLLIKVIEGYVAGRVNKGKGN
ncbi:XRE family transcriptional regulator [Stenotrophomonas acidaminiphila]|uniref:helix-turn-helix domain-containing protein n=1 Tax=Stenotrophomonas acidaminiphila TaxID=128780 RepID=UPI00240719BE|nr:helix-turn-helix transcriptional regulator [Stenotrophomonas acidaminiphila]MDF9442573.1 XRE family transcriptional regulator [Stenotrophomonas acidaminiphila]